MNLSWIIKKDKIYLKQLRGGGCVIFIEIIANDIEEYVGLLTLQFRISIGTFFKLEKN